MRKVFILMLFALSLVSYNNVMASSCLDQTVIYNEEGQQPDTGDDGSKKKDGKKDDKKNPEEDCE